MLTSASLMVGSPAAADAVARARRLPNLAVGLHLALVDAEPVLPAAWIPDLVGPDGRFSTRQALAGFNYFFRPKARRQLESEIRAQFDAFARTGLALDHVNAHKHMHLHPTIAEILVRVGRDYAMPAVRVPAEPADVLRRAEPAGAPGPWARLGDALVVKPWVAQLRRRLQRAGIAANDHVFGIAWSGAMTEERLLALLDYLPDGVSEIYLHPASSRTPRLKALMPSYAHVEEMNALLSPAVKSRIADRGLVPGGFSARAA